ncbi:dihydrodipicolinate synthase family protein [Alistipes sp. An66]|uniref:dihydrodipicolinate synthase family protein n=1 Tax=Alistipes sp. An66 TaxID=1965650 RepID=UPI000B3699ED|nr:dihydrodipicolinate synthase family protein [Alistipes sp. An66]OUN55971.1 N-acetylneuraminate lyase [Alistipes sp. An66]
MFNSKKLEGLIAAPFTPMRDDTTIDTSVIVSYADYLMETGVTGVFICGTTGESASLTTEERKRIAEAWVKSSSGRLKVIVHVGSNCAAEAITLARHAEQIGADAIGAMAPYFFKPQTVAELVDWFTPIANSTSLPFYYYNMPSMSGVSLPVADFLAAGKKKMPTLVGVKFTHNNLMEMSECLMLENSRYEVLHGYDEILLCGLSLGVKAAVGSTYNYAARVYNRLLAAFHSADLKTAAALQLYSVKIVEIIIKYGGGVRGGKAIMNLIGIDCGPCRLPLRPFSATEYDALKRDLESIDFFNHIK